MSALSTASVATVAGPRAHRLVGLTALDPDAVVVGPAATCRCVSGDNLALHLALRSAPSGSVLVCEAGGDVEHAYFGELMALDAATNGVAGAVVDGATRDRGALRTAGLPVFHRGFAPEPCVKEAAASVGVPVQLVGVAVAPGDVVVADGDGVLVVGASDWPEVEEEALELDLREDAIRDALVRGERLADLLALDPGGDA